MIQERPKIRVHSSMLVPAHEYVTKETERWLTTSDPNNPVIRIPEPLSGYPASQEDVLGVMAMTTQKKGTVYVSNGKGVPERVTGIVAVKRGIIFVSGF